MTFSFTVGGSRNESPYHPFSAEQAVAFDRAVDELGAALQAVGLHATVSGSRPGTQAEYEARPMVGTPPGADTSNTQFSKSF